MTVTAATHTPPANPIERELALIVEDDVAVSKVLTRVAEDVGLSCHSSPSAEDALHKLALRSFHFIILDLRLPGASGEDLLRKLRRDGCDVPVIVVSGTRDIATRVRLLEAGADDYVTKPFDVLELEMRLRAVRRRSSTRRSRSLFDGQLVLDPASRRISSRSLTTRCTAMEFGILWLLSVRPGECVTAPGLCREVMEDDSSACISSLKSHINHVRTKLSEIGCEVEVQTLREHGYRLALRGKG